MHLRLAPVLGVLCMCVAAGPRVAEAQCSRKAPETFVQAAHRCAGWLQHPSDPRVPTVSTTEGAFTVERPAANRAELFPGAEKVVGDVLMTLGQIAVERARRQGLALVHNRIEAGVCRFPVPDGFAVSPPVLPETCALIQATDLLALVGQARSLRTAVILDVTRVASLEFSARFNDLPIFTAPANAAFSLVRRYAHDPAFRPGRDDVRPIAEAFLNAHWARDDLGHLAPLVPLTKEVATLQVSLSAARVYLLAMQMRAEVQRTHDAAVTAALNVEKPAPPAPDVLRESIDVVTVIDLQRRACPVVHAANTTVCPLVDLDVLDWTNLAVRAIAQLQAAAVNYQDSLRATVVLVFDGLRAVQSTRRDLVNPSVLDPEMPTRLATIRWARAIALAAIDSDAPRLVSALADIARLFLPGEACDSGCAGRRKMAALLGAVAAYSQTYVQVPADATDAQKVQFLEAQQTARKEALESVINAATDRQNRGGEAIWSFGAGVGASLASLQHVIGASGVDVEAIQLQVPIGIAWQRLPGGAGGWKGIPLHVMGTLVDLGHYVATDRSVSESPDWQAILAPGIQAGIPIGKSPSNFFVVGGSASYAPRFNTTATEVRSAWHLGGFVSFFVPFWDMN